MKLIDRYVYDVVRRLPEKQRQDVAKELTSEIEEMAVDRSGSKKTTDQAVYDVLIELGDPCLLADKYRERPRYIIGPEYYELYITILKTVCIVALPLLAFITLLTEMMSGTHTVPSLFLKIAGVVFETAVHIFFWTTLSFVVVQETTNLRLDDSEWKPEDLPELPPEQEIGRSESYFAIAWSVFAVLATLFQVPFIYNWLGPDEVPQFFAPGMWPGWTLGLLSIALLGLVVEFIKLRVGGWTKLTVGLITLVNIVTIGFFVTLIQSVHPIANPAMLELLDDKVAGSVGTGITIFVVAVAVICLWEIGEAIYKYRKGAKK